MDTYGVLREFADSWFLLFMFVFFICAIIWAFWPASASARVDAAQIPFREKAADCSKDCATCKCHGDLFEGGRK